MKQTQIMKIDLNKLPIPANVDLVRSELGFIEGDDGWIITCNELVHWGSKESGATIQLVTFSKTERDGKMYMAGMPDGEIEFTKEQIVAALDGPIVDLDKWIHYWGRKPRIYSNLGILIDTCSKIGAVVDWPKWKES